MNKTCNGSILKNAEKEDAPKKCRYNKEWRVTEIESEMKNIWFRQAMEVKLKDDCSSRSKPAHIS